MARGKHRYYIEEAQFDPNPLYAVAVADGIPQHWMAFDPKYGPESQAQIDWHTAQEKLDTSDWKVGEPLPPLRPL